MNGSQIVYGDAEPYTLNELIDAIETNTEVSYHEVITRPDVRLFIDMDHTNRATVSRIYSLLVDRINEMGIFEQELPRGRAVCYDYGIEASMHIIFPLIVDIRVQFELFSMLKEQL